MNAIILNIFFVIVWTVLGHFFPSIVLIGTFLAFPLMIIITEIFIKYSSPLYFVIPFIFFLLLLNDYLFRIFGGGIHDDAGRGWCELSFYLTFITTSMSLFVLTFNIWKVNNGFLQSKLFNFILVLLCGFAAFVIFKKFNMHI